MAKDILLTLGTFKFGISTAAYESLTRSAAYLWPEQPVVGSVPVLQFTGQEAQTISMRGTIYPTRTGNPWEVGNLRALASRGIPLFLVAGTGRVFGRWVITNVSEVHARTFGDGTPRKVEFDLTLKKYDDGQPDRSARPALPSGDAAINLTSITTGNIA